MKTLNPPVARVLKRPDYPLSLRHLEEMMAELGVSVDHSTVHRWDIKLLPVLEKAFRRHKRSMGKSWRVDETDIKVGGQWKGSGANRLGESVEVFSPTIW